MYLTALRIHEDLQRLGQMAVVVERFTLALCAAEERGTVHGGKTQATVAISFEHMHAWSGVP
jgi:MOSC domain-containing protein YiiM